MSRTIPARRGRPDAAPLPQRKTSLSLRLKRVSRAWQLYVLLAPAIIYILVFKYWPMYGVQIAFKNYNPVDGFTDSPWVGLTHFIRFVNSYQFGQVVGNTLWIAILGLLVAFPIPIILALLVNQLQSERFKKRIRHIDLPGIMPVVTILFILAIGNLLNVGFEKALLMQTPLNTSTSEIIQTYVYHAGLQQAQFSSSAAIGLFNSLLNLALLLVFNTIARRANQATLW